MIAKISLSLHDDRRFHRSPDSRVIQVDGEDSEFSFDFLKAVARFGVIQDDASIEKHAFATALANSNLIEMNRTREGSQGVLTSYLPLAVCATGASRCSTCFRISWSRFAVCIQSRVLWLT